MVDEGVRETLNCFYSIKVRDCEVTQVENDQTFLYNRYINLMDMNPF